MGFFDSAQVVFDKGVSVAKETVSGVAIENQSFARAFSKLCMDGSSQGWHESNGGNLSYRMKAEEVNSCRSFFFDSAGQWMTLDSRIENLAGEFFLVTASGCHLRSVGQNLSGNAGIIEVSDSGNFWRVVWGFQNDTKPTSEFSSHLSVQSARKNVTDGACRVLYHVHPSEVIAFTKVIELDARIVSRTLWKTMLEAMVVFPGGVGVVPWMVPGGQSIAQASAEAMKNHEACIWAHHGLLCSGKDFDAVFGLVQTIEKAASIYAQARIMNGGSDEFLNSIPDEDLRSIAQAYGLKANEDYL